MRWDGTSSQTGGSISVDIRVSQMLQLDYSQVSEGSAYERSFLDTGSRIMFSQHPRK